MLATIGIALGLLILLALTFAPLESLGWWAREGADEAASTVTAHAAQCISKTSMTQVAVPASDKAADIIMKGIRRVWYGY